MKDLTRRLWDKQNHHPGDRHRLFAALGDTHDISTVLYPGSFVDIAPSFVFEDVSYVDSDDRARRFFEDAAGVDEIIAANGGRGRWHFTGGDYRADLELEPASLDLLVSLYAGFVSEHCSKYLRPDGLLLAAPSHGDVAMATLDDDYRLAGVVISGSGGYRISDKDLDTYLVPRDDTEVTAELLHDRGRGIAYTRSPFAYLFRRR